MAFLLVLKPSAQKEFDRIRSPHHARLMVACTAIRRDPYGGKKLKGRYRGYYGVRVWPYRIIYRIYKPDSLVIIARIGHRQSIY